MTNRKTKLRITQIGLLILATLIIFLTYNDQGRLPKEKIISKETQDKIKSRLDDETLKGDVFYNIEYSGLDLNGNRYILNSEEASNNRVNSEIINMKVVTANFYFKDGKVLYVKSNNAKYNNITLDIIFSGDVKGIYEGSKLFSQKAEYSNSKGFLIISDKVKIIDIQGTMVADKLLFDIKKQTLNVSSFNDNKINANINLK
jgi:lipopolysaccharide assembly outer membrane protein LptD (OstA)